jgi:hypothetical protein
MKIGIDFQYAGFDPTEVHDDARAGAATGHRATCPPGDEAVPGVDGPSHQHRQVIDRLRQCHGLRHDAINAGTFGIRGPGTPIGSEETLKRGWRCR